jgi:hypothetical protein
VATFDSDVLDLVPADSHLGLFSGAFRENQEAFLALVDEVPGLQKEAEKDDTDRNGHNPHCCQEDCYSRWWRVVDHPWNHREGNASEADDGHKEHHTAHKQV